MISKQEIERFVGAFSFPRAVDYIRYSAYPCDRRELLETQIALFTDRAASLSLGTTLAFVRACTDRELPVDIDDNNGQAVAAYCLKHLKA